MYHVETVATPTTGCAVVPQATTSPQPLGLDSSGGRGGCVKSGLIEYHPGGRPKRSGVRLLARIFKHMPEFSREQGEALRDELFTLATRSEMERDRGVCCKAAFSAIQGRAAVGIKLAEMLDRDDVPHGTSTINNTQVNIRLDPGDSMDTVAKVAQMLGLDIEQDG